jgi:hypothetical protein
LTDPKPLPPFALNGAQRAALPPQIDAEALEFLLGRLPTEARDFVLRFCQATASTTEEGLRALLPEGASHHPNGNGFLPPQLDDLTFDDPELIQLLHAVNRDSRR